MTGILFMIRIKTNILHKLLTLLESPSNVRYLTDQVQSLREENRAIKQRCRMNHDELVKLDTEIDKYTEQLARSWRLIGTVNVDRIKDLIQRRDDLIKNGLTVLQHTKDDSFCSCCICSPCGCDTEE